VTNFYRFFETDLLATVLLIQSLPFLSAVALVWLERVGDRKSRKRADKARYKAAPKSDLPHLGSQSS
jgi:hypothetical protein